jgi:glycerol-1-phosphate dehydrogenase [NAD(P)+]
MTLAQKCDCGNQHNPIPIEKIMITSEINNEIVTYLRSNGFENPVLIADHNTFRVAGENFTKELMKANIQFSAVLIQPDENSDVVADENSLVQALLGISKETDVIVVIGAGTLHDIARFCSAKLRIPFISVPTAPSVDGFTSMGAPLIIRGVKTTYQMTAPIAVFVNLAIQKESPQKMIAAGFGDMIAKYTSLADWKFGHLVKGEPYCPLVASITQNALESCIGGTKKIAKRDEEGIQILIEALIKSGLAMLIFGQSHPASGGEHHLSHFWEMDFLRKKHPAVLHGAKVGIATTILSDVYKTKFLSFITNPTRLQTIENKEIAGKIQEHIQEITKVYQEIPDPILLGSLLTSVGGPTKPMQLGIEQQLVELSLRESHHLRKRFTALKFMNEASII